MKAITYIRTIALAGLAIAATACDENSWNDHLDGFKDFEDQPFSQVETVEYTLTELDYGTIAGLADNKTIAGTDGAAALKAIGDLKRFSAEAPADKYVPAFLSTTSFPYFTLTDGSAVKLTYNQAVDEPEGFAAAAAAKTYKITDDQYQNEVWDGENYILGFAPSQTAADFIPTFLADGVADAAEGDFVIVNYNQATQEPVFGGDVPAVPEVVYSESLTTEEGFKSFTIDNVSIPAELSYVWSFGGENYGAKASAFAGGTNYASESWLISPVVDLTGYADPFFSFEQATNFFSNIDAIKTEATVWVREEGGAWSQITDYVLPEKLSWTFVGSGDIDLTAYAGKKMQIGFKFVSATKSGTWEVKNITVTATPASRSAASRARVEVPMVSKNVLYTYTGTAWTPAPALYAVLSPADYTAMGQSHPNLPAAEPFLTKWLNMNYAYAESGDRKFIVWTKYDGKATNQCSAFTFNGTEWVSFKFVEEVTSQFVRTGGKWMYDPNVTITLPAGKNIEISAKYYQACVDWVYENKCVPLGDTSIKSGLYWVTKYGNNEYYSGTSAYQGNVDLRADAARTQYAAGFEGMNDAAVINFMKDNFMNEVMPAALSTLHTDADVVAGFDVLYTVNFYAYEYNETEKKYETNPYTAVFKVVGKGKFEPVSCTWYPKEK